MKTCAVIPAHNEQENIGAVLKACKPHVDQIIVVDDGSRDNTAQEALKNEVKLIRFEERRGKGTAIRRGIEEAVKSNFEAIVKLDADGEHDPNEIPKLLDELKKGTDIAIGSRLKEGKQARSLSRYLLNSFARFWINVALNLDIKDTQCGFMAIKAEALKKLNLTSEGFEIEMEMILESGKNNLTLKEVPITILRHSPSRVRTADMMKLNIFFDRWMLDYIKSKNCKLNIFKKAFLGFFSTLGLILSYPTLWLLGAKKR